MNKLSNTQLDALTVQHDARQGERTMAAVHSLLGRFVAYPSEHAHVAHSLWILHSHLMDRWESTPRLAFLSAEPASGKTRALEITELLVPSPVPAVNVSPAYLFRKVGGDEPVTILFDEIDTVFGPKAKENEELRGLLNAGHRRGAVAGRCVVHGKAVMTEELPAYSAVALAGLGWLPETIMSRSVIVRMRRRHQGEQVEPFRRRIHAPEGDRVRHEIERWARSVPTEITWPELPVEITDRPADVWEPLIAVADLVGGEWPARSRAAAVALVVDAAEGEPSLGVRLLADLRIVFGNEDAMASKAVLGALHAMLEAPWNDLRGKPLDERGLATRLRPYGVRPKQIRVGHDTPRGYSRQDLKDAWVRYLPQPSDESKTDKTSTTDTISSTPDVLDVADVLELPAARGEGSRRHKCSHCGKRGETVQAAYDGLTPWLHRQCIDSWIADYNERVGAD